MIGDGNLLGTPNVHRNAVLSRSSVAAPAEIQAGVVLVDSHVCGVTVHGATLIGVRVTGSGSIRGRLVIRAWGYKDHVNLVQDGVEISKLCNVSGVSLHGRGSIRGNVMIEPTEAT